MDGKTSYNVANDNAVFIMDDGLATTDSKQNGGVSDAKTGPVDGHKRNDLFSHDQKHHHPHGDPYV